MAPTAALQATALVCKYMLFFFVPFRFVFLNSPLSGVLLRLPIEEVVVLAHWKSPTVLGGPSDRTEEGGWGAGQ